MEAVWTPLATYHLPVPLCKLGVSCVCVGGNVLWSRASFTSAMCLLQSVLHGNSCIPRCVVYCGTGNLTVPKQHLVARCHLFDRLKYTRAVWMHRYYVQAAASASTRLNPHSIYTTPRFSGGWKVGGWGGGRRRGSEKASHSLCICRLLGHSTAELPGASASAHAQPR